MRTWNECDSRLQPANRKGMKLWEHGMNVIPVYNLLTGKTSNEVARMVFERLLCLSKLKNFKKWLTILSLINSTSTLQVLKTKDYIHVDCKTGGFLWKHQCISVSKAMNDLLSSWLWEMEIMKSLAIKHATHSVFLSVFLYINQRSNSLTNNEFKCI